MQRRGAFRLTSCFTPFLGVIRMTRTRLVSLGDAAAWCGVTLEVVLSSAELAGKPVLDMDGEPAEIGSGSVFLEVDSDFVDLMGVASESVSDDPVGAQAAGTEMARLSGWCAVSLRS